LYINYDVISSALELIRRITDIHSTSKPHITIRGPLNDLSKISLKSGEIEIKEIELIRPGKFQDSTEKNQNTIFIHCSIKELEVFHQKRDYMTSLPHITLYDGDSTEFAEKLLDTLESFHWHLKVELEEKSSIKLIDIKRKHKIKKNLEYSTEIINLFQEITGKLLTRDLIINLTDDERINYVKDICSYLEKSVLLEEKYYDDEESGIRIELNHSVKALRDLEKIYGENQIELDLIKKSHKNAINLNKKEMRGYLGQFLTPPELAIEVVKNTQKYLSEDEMILFGDPSIGSGTFFSALKQVFPESRIESAIGIEIDRTISTVAKRLWGKYHLKIMVGDFFNVDLPEKRNLILNNPPYVRHHKIRNKQKMLLISRIKNEYGINISAKSSLYVYFVILSCKWLKENGIAAWLIPSEFMETDYGLGLREFLSKKVTLLRVHRFDPNEYQFEGVNVTTSVIIIRNSIPNEKHEVLFTSLGSLSSPKHSSIIPLKHLENSDKWYSDVRNINRNKNFLKLNDIFYIKRGIATGANNFFILRVDEIDKLGIPQKFTKPILPRPRYLSNDIILQDSNGFAKTDPQLCVIDCSLNESVIKKEYRKFWNYLQKGLEMGIRDRYLVKSHNPWYKQEKREVPRFLCTYFGREKKGIKTFKFIWNKSNSIATNSYLLLYPKDILKKLIEQNEVTEQEIFNILQSISMDEMKIESRIYGGGLLKLEPKDLGLINANNFLKILKMDKAELKSAGKDIINLENFN
jgi:hypothetical protein